MSTQTVIRAENASIKINGQLIWSQGTFTIEKGSITAIIGSNGAGKTTLAQMILGLIKPTTGKIETFEKEIGYVSQKYDSDTDNALRGVDFISVCALNIPLKKRKDEVNKAISLVGAEAFVKKRLSQLSGGQRQRIAIASALVGENKMLILDEPLSSLDLETAKEIVALLKDLNDRFGMTILIVAHDLALLLPILTGAIYLVDGHAHHSMLDDDAHHDYGDLLDHLKIMKVMD